MMMTYVTSLHGGQGAPWRMTAEFMLATADVAAEKNVPVSFASRDIVNKKKFKLKKKVEVDIC